MGSEIAIAVLLVAGLLILLLLGLEIGWSIGIVAVVGLTWYIDQPISQVAETAWSLPCRCLFSWVPSWVIPGSMNVYLPPSTNGSVIFQAGWRSP
jgi:hypothetical protein